ncbi:MAG TPA: adenylate/guanylate cyclase domain-containing protein [Candidatus Baltobacteraceae bacterium]|nr:adenylate/guanylate cyclase domain-containing protein [Candidatus Baltobacteraceae bacterium]
MALRLLRKAVIPVLLTLCAIAVAAVSYRAPLGSFTTANRIADLKIHADAQSNAGTFGLRNAPSYDEPNDSLALLQIDEKTLDPQSGLPSFPFPRSLYGTLLKRLAAAGAKAVAFDIDFLSPAADPAQDAAFAAGGRVIPAAIGYTIDTTTGGYGGSQLPPPALQAALHIGYTTVDSPADIIIGQPLRIAPMPVPGGVANSLALAAVQAFRREAVDVSHVPSLNNETLLVPVHVRGQPDPVYRGEEIWNVPYVSQSLSFVDAMREPVADLRAFAQGRIVLVGMTAQAEGDVTGALGTDARVPGVFVHARLIDQLLRGMYLRPAPDWLNLSLLVLLPLLLTAMVLRLRPIVAAPLAAVAIAAYIEISIALFVYRLYWLDVLHVAAAMLLTALGVIAYRAIGEAAQKRAVTAAFGLHVSPDIVTELLKHEGGADDALAGKRAKVTIFYSDIRGFTAMSEKLSPEAVYEQLNEYFEAMCEVIFKYGGYVDKFIGDCIMAVFSAPNPTPGDAMKAVHAALEQQEIIGVLAQRWREQGKPPLAVGMGINTGYVVMGNLGSQKRMNYTVIGDDVNIAARLYNVAKGGQIIISESTYEEVKDAFDFRELEPVSVKGKSAPLRTFEVLARKGSSDAPAAAPADATA